MENVNLEKIGFTANEAKVYLALLELGEAQAGLISKRSQVNRTNTYDCLERLADKGLVTFYLTSSRKMFKPVDPRAIMSYLKEKETVAEEAMPELLAAFNGKKQEEEAMIFKGRKGIKSVLNDIIKSSKSYVAFGSSGKFMEIMKYDFTLFQNQKKELKIFSRIIQAESARKNKELQRVAYANFRYLPDKFVSPTTTIVYGNKVAIIVWSTVPIANVISSKLAADSFSNYFEVLWKSAKK